MVIGARFIGGVFRKYWYFNVLSELNLGDWSILIGE